MMRLAVIDLGTNTFHLLIVDLEGEDFSVVYREKTAVRIGKDGISEGFITDEARQRAIKALKRFREVIDIHEAEEVSATATSAIRNAKNGEELVAEILKTTGISVRIIDGLQEASYIYNGVKKALNIGSHPTLVMDIGGGSIEFIIGNQEKIFWKHSYEIGGQRLIDRFHASDPISKTEQKELLAYLKQELSSLRAIAVKYDVKTLIGSSGTFDTLSDIYCVKNGLEKDLSATEYPLDFEQFRTIVDEVISKTRAERLEIPGMIEMRVDMIVVAVILVQFVVEYLGITNMRVSSYALKEGVLLNAIEQIRSKSMK